MGIVFLCLMNGQRVPFYLVYAFIPHKLYPQFGEALSCSLVVTHNGNRMTAR